MLSKKEFEFKIEEYFKLCQNTNKPFTISGLCLYLKIEKLDFLKYLEIEKTSFAAKNAKTRIENWIEENALSGKLNSTMAIFVLKSIFGWSDKETNGKITPVTIINDLVE
ncbi:MAG: DNA-packaging protein [Clostridiales bacterium]|jgi:hypothetical protein|nr:DNA-packaging protein [Clostridiales bacterium]